jgi:hypothetical protein
MVPRPRSKSDSSANERNETTGPPLAPSVTLVVVVARNAFMLHHNENPHTYKNKEEPRSGRY